MSNKHHQYHPSPSGGYHTTAKKAHEADMMMLVPSHHGQNGLLRPNGITNGDGDSNDTNNNHNKHSHKRSAGGSGSGAETSSSKRTKLSVPSDKGGGKADGGSKAVSHFNISEKLKELYKELKRDKSCKEVSSVKGSAIVASAMTFVAGGVSS